MTVFSQHQPLLEVKNLKKYYPVYSGKLRKCSSLFKAVDDISFSIAPGEILGMVGESGSGKTTAGKAAIALIQPTDGEVLFQGKNLFSLKSHELRQMRTQIQMIFQDPFASLNPRKTILDNIGECLLYHKIVKTTLEQIQRVKETLNQIGLSEDVLYKYPHEFSGGQQQRICIGRAIIMRPKLIICDEAVSALDISIQAQILNLLYDLKIKLGLSYLFISHDLSVIKHFCDRALVFYQGKIVESGKVPELFSNPQHPYTQTLLAAIPKKYPN